MDTPLPTTTDGDDSDKIDLDFKLYDTPLGKAHGTDLLRLLVDAQTPNNDYLHSSQVSPQNIDTTVKINQHRKLFRGIDAS